MKAAEPGRENTLFDPTQTVNADSHNACQFFLREMMCLAKPANVFAEYDLEMICQLNRFLLI